MKKTNLKAIIAPHGDEDSIKTDIRNDCPMISPVGMRIRLSIDTINKCYITRFDVKTSFLQIGEPTRGVLVIPPCKSRDRGKFLRLLLVGAYGLVNANEKWQVLSDWLFIEIGFEQMNSIPQLFIINMENQLTCILETFVDDILITGNPDVVDKVVKEIEERFKFGTVARGPGKLRLFDLNLIQNEYLPIETNGDDKLNELEVNPIPKNRRQKIYDPIKSIEKESFTSLNSSNGWIGITSHATKRH